MVGSMKILKHAESHIVEFDDGSKWQIYPGDVDVTLNWQPEVNLKLVHIEGELSSHALISSDDNSRVRVRPLGDKWPVGLLKEKLGSS